MANMSYCRFTNTRQDMDECLEALRDEKRLSDFEVRAGRNMFRDVLEFCQEQGIIDAFDDEMLEHLFVELQENEDEEDDE